MTTRPRTIESDRDNLRANVIRHLEERNPTAVANALGVEIRTIMRWRRGLSVIDSRYLPSLARYLRVPIDDLYAPIDET